MNARFFAWWPQAIVVLAAILLLLSALAVGAVSDHPRAAFAQQVAALTE